MSADTETEIKQPGRLQRPWCIRAMSRHFPALTQQGIARMRRFGEVRHYKHGERLFETGKAWTGMFVVLSGHVAITPRDGLGHG